MYQSSDLGEITITQIRWNVLTAPFFEQNPTSNHFLEHVRNNERGANPQMWGFTVEMGQTSPNG